MVRVVGKEGALGAGVGWEMQQRHGRLLNDNEAISRAWKCLFLWRISISGGAFKQEKARTKVVCIYCIYISLYYSYWKTV